MQNKTWILLVLSDFTIIIPKLCWAMCIFLFSGYFQSELAMIL